MKDVNDRLNEIEDENKILKIKMKDDDNENENDKNKIDVLALEHLSEILLAKTSNGKDLNQSVKFKFSEIFGAEFTANLEILATKLHVLEGGYYQLTEKYHTTVIISNYNIEFNVNKLVTKFNFKNRRHQISCCTSIKNSRRL